MGMTDKTGEKGKTDNICNEGYLVQTSNKPVQLVKLANLVKKSKTVKTCEIQLYFCKYVICISSLLQNVFLQFGILYFCITVISISVNLQVVFL